MRTKACVRRESIFFVVALCTPRSSLSLSPQLFALFSSLIIIITNPSHCVGSRVAAAAAADIHTLTDSV